MASNAQVDVNPNSKLVSLLLHCTTRPCVLDKKVLSVQWETCFSGVSGMRVRGRTGCFWDVALFMWASADIWFFTKIFIHTNSSKEKNDWKNTTYDYSNQILIICDQNLLFYISFVELYSWKTCMTFRVLSISLRTKDYNAGDLFIVRVSCGHYERKNSQRHVKYVRVGHDLSQRTTMSGSAMTSLSV